MTKRILLLMLSLLPMGCSAVEVAVKSSTDADVVIVHDGAKTIRPFDTDRSYSKPLSSKTRHAWAINFHASSTYNGASLVLKHDRRLFVVDDIWKVISTEFCEANGIKSDDIRRGGLAVTQVFEDKVQVKVDLSIESTQEDFSKVVWLSYVYGDGSSDLKFKLPGK